MTVKNIFVCPRKIIVFFFLFITIGAYSQYVFNSDRQPQRISLNEYTSIIDVGQKNLEIHYVLNNFKSLQPIDLKTNSDYLGFTENNFWSMTPLVNNTNSEFNCYIEIARPITDLVELFIVDQATGTIQRKISGDAMSFKERSYPSRGSLFSLVIAPKANLKLVAHIKSDGEVVKLPIVLYSTEGFITINSSEQFVFGLFYGILAIVAVIYFFFFIGLKEPIFLYYSLYVASVGLLQFALDGYFFQYITPEGGWLSNHAVLFLAIIGAFLSGKYSELFLKVKENSHTIYLMFNLSYGLLLILLFFSVFVPAALPYCYQVVNLLVLIFLLLIIFAIGYLYYHNKVVDTFFSIGIFFLIVGFGVFILNNLGLIENTFMTQNSSKIGTGLEVIFLSLSMSNLIRKLKNEKNEFNRIALMKSEEMNELKSYFLSNISHELRTPLNAITNLIDVVSNDVKNKKVKKNCALIKYSSHSLLSSVNDILDFSKIEKNELVLENKEFDFLTVLKNVKFNAKRKAKEKSLKFSYNKPDVDGLILVGDEDKLTQILNNVLNNAIKFTSEGFVSFSVESKKLTAERVSIVITISDSGIGIHKEKIDSIFDSFSQNKIDNKRKFGGLGLGLYIVKTLVDMQGGDIIINSEVGLGTAFKIMMEYDIVQTKVAEVVPITIQDYDLGRKTILVVEDNPMNQMVIKMITKKWLNTTVIYANNGQEGLDAFANHKIDLILMDLQMPVMDGYEATIAIRNGVVGPENANIPIIALTADVMENTKLRVAEIGMNHYLSKPVNKEVLFQTIKDLI
jgi:two-component system, sensor histidine kinase LadS